MPMHPLGGGKFLRVVRGFKHLGVVANSNTMFNHEIAARLAAAGGIEAALSRAVRSHKLFLQSVRVNVASGIQTSLLHPSLSPA